MPTIEIVSIEAKDLTFIPTLSSMKIRAELQDRVVSHRWLFAPELALTSGAILHLGSPSLDDDSPFWWASDLVNWTDEPIAFPIVGGPNGDDTWGADQVERFQLKPTSRRDIERLLQLAVQASPIGQAIFLTDYQFGPRLGCVLPPRRQGSLWDEHDAAGLRWNHLYRVGS